jgi:hypothetical protein
MIDYKSSSIRLNDLNLLYQNLTINGTTSALITLGPPLVIFTSIGIIIGTIFSILCIIRYLNEPNKRTHYTYIVSKIKVKK